MAKPKKKIRRRVRIKKSASIKKKSEVRSDTLMKAPTRLAPDAGANFKIKIRRKR